MKIIFANKYFFLRGGTERYLFELSDMLRKKGHDVIPFAMKDERNLPSTWSPNFVSHVETERVGFSWQALRTAARVLYSTEARRKFAQLLDETLPSMVHIHNIYHQMSPSFLPEADRRRMPIVMTAHDYNLIAPNYSLYHDGAICEHTKPDNFFSAIPNRCVKHSYFASALDATAMTLHRMLGLYDSLRAIIVPSEFMLSVFKEYGADSSRLVHIPHFVDTTKWTSKYGGGYALYVGRLSKEKGVDVLLRAANIAREIPVRIVGDGPENAALRALAAELELRNVEFVGAKSGADLQAEYANARFLTVPSVWYEPFGLVVLESYATGKPVIASRIGGLAEVVRDHETGLSIPAGDAEVLASAMLELWRAPVAAERLGRAGRAWVEKDFTPAKHFEAIMKVYNNAREPFR